MNDYVRELADVEAKVRSVENAPWEDALQTLQRCSRRLATLVSLEPNSRATDLLIQISRQYYMRGYTRNADCLGLAALTVQAATRTGDLAKLRQALSIQGLFLGECGCFLDALRVLSRALDAATQLSDPRGVGAAWLNIGVAMSKARLMRETIACAMRALATVDDMADARERANMTMLAQHNISDSYIHLQQFEKALAWSKRAIAIVADEPTITTKNWGVPAHSNAAR